MSQYPLIIATLREFDLISEEQHDAAMAEWREQIENYYREQDEFRDRWQAERVAKPWWRRIGTDETGWVSEWFKTQ